ncbi:MAG TPA: nucleoside hydrolase [Terracidiphilus sp.]|jgi:inosine-uridine nucleoside N-ribohydrolase/acetyl esterase/lipase
MNRALLCFAALFICSWTLTRAGAQSLSELDVPQKVIFDTDIGDDLDDAFALALALSSSKLQVIGVTTAWGDTNLRARLAARLLAQTGNSEIPVAAGPKTESNSPFTQRRWAEGWPQPKEGWPDAIGFTLDEIRRNPGQITLISVSPFSNVGALIDRDPDTFRKLKKVIIMGGSIRRGYGDLGYLPDHGPDPEYNILLDIPSARKLFASGVPLYVMPLDSTQLKLQEVLRNTLFSQGTPVTDALALLYAQWTASTQNPTPTLFDAMAVAAAIEPGLCPTQQMHIEIDSKGYTRETPGTPNAQVCLNSSPEKFFDFYIHTVMHPGRRPLGTPNGTANTALPGIEPGGAEPSRTYANHIPQQNSSYVDETGAAHIERVVPVPTTVTPEAQKLIGSNFANPSSSQIGNPEAISPERALANERAFADATEERLAKQALAMFPADVRREVIAGVPVREITPKTGLSSNPKRILINLHGGGFVADWGSLTETIPIACLTHTRVISVLYRLSPEHPFPAAVNDATAVYLELLKTYKPGSIGVYGTSAGAILTAETATNLRRLGLPLPGALGIFSGTGDLSRRGDTYSIFSVTGLAGALESKTNAPFYQYVENTDPHDPVLSPFFADLGGFPPTLFLSSTRDMLLSDTAILHRAFLKAGVQAQLVVFEGLQHGFWNDPTLPESREADRVIANFFVTYLMGRDVKTERN